MEGNAIYTLIMPARLNIGPDRCNILDMSASFSCSPLPFPALTPSRMVPELRADVCFARHEYRTVGEREVGGGV